MKSEKININLFGLKKISEISKIIKQSKTFFIAGHVKPDGDSLGSALALSSVLKRLGKKACVYADKVPDFLKFLKGADKIKKSAKKTDKFDCAIILESINFSRMGDIITPDQSKKIINIDHHSSYENFGTVNYIVPSSSSTSELILNILEYMKIKLTKSEAESLYTGILTDTGRFQQTNTTCNSHIAAVKLMKYGIDVNSIYKKIYEDTSIHALKLQGLALCNIKTIFNNRVSYIVLTKDMFKKSGANDEDSEGIVSYTLKITCVEVGCIFKEIDKKTTRISCRSARNFDLLDVVGRFGGGGHKNAAGCTIKENIGTAIKMISNVLKEKFDDKKI
ncbi:1-pyrroline-5-carboxylate dehydrogenase [Endomicrobiia bacterium]|nr:1-pyrroline-5-carboxylate dehydrogenase [Endomicrobiia bacterium]GHT66153.1 1-pyrroline-5-carboxylate dehydrogenase [Endomicrobiia bacterium]GHT75906.1 1-pyrroline-5-carboxylate dehydrogenase [Endomicrobiia bacterium]